MRGVTLIVELVIVILIIISLATLFWFFTYGTVEELTTSGTGRTERTREILSSCMIIDSVYENKIYIKNCGGGVILNDSLNVFLDDELFEHTMFPESIKKGEVGTIIANLFGVRIGDHNLKITNPNIYTIQKVEAILHDSAILALDFDEGEGTIAYDKSGYANDGTIYGATWRIGKSGKALDFDGDLDYLVTNYRYPFKQEMTVSAWFKINDWGSRAVIGRYHYTSIDQGWMLYRNSFWGDGLLSWLFRYEGTDGDSEAQFMNYPGLSTGIWYHAAVTIYPDGSYKTYLNGNLHLEGTASNFIKWGGNDTDSEIQLTIGRGGENTGWYYNGTIDSVRIFNKTLTPNETVSLKIK